MIRRVIKTTIEKKKKVFKHKPKGSPGYSIKLKILHVQNNKTEWEMSFIKVINANSNSV